MTLSRGSASPLNMKTMRKYKAERGNLPPQQLEHFRERLLKLKHELEEKLEKHVLPIQEESLNEPDFMDRASIETNRSLDVETRNRERRLIFKIDQALDRINKGTYGFCEETGAPIGLARLEAYPMTTLCLEAQKFFEGFEKTHQVKSF